jgi:hypothetical protein
VADAVDVVPVAEDSVDVVLNQEDDVLLVEKLVSLDKDDEVVDKDHNEVIEELVTLLEDNEDVVVLSHALVVLEEVDEGLEVAMELLVLKDAEELPVEEIVTTGHDVVVVRMSVNVVVANDVVVCNHQIRIEVNRRCQLTVLREVYLDDLIPTHEQALVYDAIPHAVVTDVGKGPYDVDVKKPVDDAWRASYLMAPEGTENGVSISGNTISAVVEVVEHGTIVVEVVLVTTVRVVL